MNVPNIVFLTDISNFHVYRFKEELQSNSGLVCDAALRMIGVKFFTEISIHLFIENSIRGGMSMISPRYASANHPDNRSYDPQKDLTHLIYIDADNF